MSRRVPNVRPSKPRKTPATPLPPPERGERAVFMISLLRTPERMRRGFDTLRCLNPELLPACDGKAERRNLPVAAESRLQDGEAGLNQSWFNAAVQIVARNADYALVFEDDVVWVRDSADLQQGLDSLPPGWDIALLHDSVQPPPVVTSDHGIWMKVSRCSYATVAMAVSQAGARKILSGLAPFTAPIDVWFRENSGNMDFYQVKRESAWFAQSFWLPSEVRDTSLPGEIPAILHRVWVGSPLPKAYADYGKTWEKFHPDMRSVLWDERAVRSKFPGHSDLLDLCIRSSPAMFSDVARLLILEKYGGLYVDTDFECFHSFGEILRTGSVIVADMHDGTPCNGWMAAAPGNPIIREMIRLCEERVPTGAHILEACGPVVVKTATDPWRNAWPKNIVTREGVHVATSMGDTGLVIVKPATLFPYYWTNMADWTGDPKGAWAAHHWAKSWWTEADYRK